MRVRLGTIEVTDGERRVISLDGGRLATREEVRLYFICSAQGELAAAVLDYLETLEELEVDDD
tara:strand:+ start:6036 stop:6224 length:189 start_codon:yes stop_codon:yes gene_type:complete